MDKSINHSLSTNSQTDKAAESTDQAHKVFDVIVGVDTLGVEQTETDNALQGRGDHVPPRTMQVTQLL